MRDDFDTDEKVLAGSRLIRLPPQAPRTGSPLWLRRLARRIFEYYGWRMEGFFPDQPRALLIVAPHSSAWDAWWGLLVKIALGLQVEFMAKREAFWWPLGWLLRRCGAFPVDRKSPGGVVGSLAERARARDQLWLLIAPEGTRKSVREWKSGFWRIAREAKLPVVCVYFHYPTRTIGIGPTIAMTEDFAADMAQLRMFYQPWVGRHRGTG